MTFVNDVCQWSPNIIYITNTNSSNWHYVRMSNMVLFTQMENSKPSSSLIMFKNFGQLLQFLHLPPFEADVTCETIFMVRDVIKRDTNLYILVNGETCPIMTIPPKYSSHPPINILLPADDQYIDFYLICNSAYITKKYICANDDQCRYQTTDKARYDDHLKICKNNLTQKIKSKQIAWGNKKSCVQQLVDLGYLPQEASIFSQKHRVTYDIETMERNKNIHKGKATVIVAEHYLLSIAVTSTLTQPKCFVRHSDEPYHAEEMVEEFMDEIDRILDLYELQIPTYFEECLHTLEEDYENESISKPERSRLRSLRTKLSSYLKLNIFGYNSGMLESYLVRH